MRETGDQPTRVASCDPDDTGAFTVVFSYDRRLWRRAMTGWWQSTVAPAPFFRRAIFWAIVWTLLAVLAMGFQAMGYSPWLVGAGLAGGGVMVAAFAYLQRTRMSRFWDEIGRHWDKAGETRVRFAAAGIGVEDDVSRRRMRWAAVDAIRAIRGGTVFRSGISMLVVPDAALPEGMTPKAFRQRLAEWRSG